MADNWWESAPIVDASQGKPKARADWGPGAVELPDSSIVRYGPKGGTTVLRKAQAASPGGTPTVDMTEGQAKDGFNAKRMTRAGQRTSQLEAGGFDPGLARLATIPVPFSKSGFSLPVGDKRSYESSETEWSDAMIRLTTGAAAKDEEIASVIKTYFPQFGDSAAVRKEKAAKRAAVERDALFRGGPGSTPAVSPSESVMDLSGGQSRETIPRGATYRDPKGNIRRNDNGDRGNPIIKPSMTRPSQPAASSKAPISPASSGYKILKVED